MSNVYMLTYAVVVSADTEDEAVTEAEQLIGSGGFPAVQIDILEYEEDEDDYGDGI